MAEGKNNPTLIWRHQRENLKKCSLRGLESRTDLHFFRYPTDQLPDLSRTILLTLEAPPLTSADGHHALLLLDATWRYAEKMVKAVERADQPPPRALYRSLPSGLRTAYPRRQEDCSDPSRGLASVEALFVAHQILGRDTAGLLDHYFWREAFIANNGLGPYTSAP